MPSRRGKRVAIVGCALALAVLAAGFSLCKDFAVRYHLHRLRAEPEYFWKAIGAAEGSAQNTAVRAFVREKKGATILLSTLLSNFERCDKGNSPGLAQTERAIVGFGEWTKLKQNEDPGLWCAFCFKNGTRSAQHRLHPHLNRGIHVQLLRLLEEIESQRHVLPDYPAFQFTVLTINTANEEVAYWAKSTAHTLPDSMKSVSADFEKYPLAILAKRLVQ